MIWATVSSQSCFCWLYRTSPSLAAKNIINMISVLTIWWCPCVESSLVSLEEGVCYDWWTGKNVRFYHMMVCKISSKLVGQPSVFAVFDVVITKFTSKGSDFSQEECFVMSHMSLRDLINYINKIPPVTCKHPIYMPGPAVSMELGKGEYAWGLLCLVGFQSWASVCRAGDWTMWRVHGRLLIERLAVSPFFPLLPSSLRLPPARVVWVPHGSSCHLSSLVLPLAPQDVFLKYCCGQVSSLSPRSF